MNTVHGTEKYLSTGSSIGQAIGEGLRKDCKYKFSIKDNNYYIQPAYESASQNRGILAEEALVLSNNEFFCSLEEPELICQPNSNAIGETMVNINDIGIVFRSETTEYKFYVKNNPSNVAPIAGFLNELGVKNFYNLLELPDEIFPVQVNMGNGLLTDECTYAAFREQGSLIMVRQYPNRTDSICIVEININDIKYYRQEGSLHYEQSISGTGGGSNSYGGAIIGGLLFGAAGAIIGSRKNDKPVNVTSTTVKLDSRVVVLCVNHEGKTYNISCSPLANDIFDWLIPEKQYDYVINCRRIKFEKENSENNSKRKINCR